MVSTMLQRIAEHSCTAPYTDQAADVRGRRVRMLRLRLLLLLD